MVTRIHRGYSPQTIAYLNDGGLYNALTVNVLGRISGDRIMKGWGPRAVLRVDDDLVRSGYSPTIVARITGNRILRGTTPVTLARIKRGVIYAGNSMRRIGDIAGPHTLPELIAILHFCFGFFHTLEVAGSQAGSQISSPSPASMIPCSEPWLSHRTRGHATRRVMLSKGEAFDVRPMLTTVLSTF